MWGRNLLNVLLHHTATGAQPVAQTPCPDMLGAKRSRNSELHREALRAQSRRKRNQERYPHDSFL